MAVIFKNGGDQFNILFNVVGYQHLQRRQFNNGDPSLSLVQCCLVRGCRLQRQGHCKDGALSQSAGDMNAATHQVYQLFGYGGAQTCTAKTARHTGIGLGKGFKYTSQPILCNTDTCITYFKTDLAGLTWR